MYRLQQWLWQCDGHGKLSGALVVVGRADDIQLAVLTLPLCIQDHCTGDRHRRKPRIASHSISHSREDCDAITIPCETISRMSKGVGSLPSSHKAAPVPAYASTGGREDSGAEACPALACRRPCDGVGALPNGDKDKTVERQAPAGCPFCGDEALAMVFVPSPTATSRPRPLRTAFPAVVKIVLPAPVQLVPFME